MPEGEVGTPEGQQDDRPEWLPENFKSPEDLARSYGEAQRKITEQGQQLSAMNQNYADLSAQLEELTAQAQQPAQQQAPSNDWLYSMYDQDPIATTALLVKQGVESALAQQQAQSPGYDEQETMKQAQQTGLLAEMQMQARYPDFQEVAGDIGEFLQANPDIIAGDGLNEVTNALDIAYRSVKYDKLMEAAASGQPVQTAEDQRQAKLQAQTQQGAGARPLTPDEATAEWEKIKAARDTPYYQGLGG